MRFPFLSLGGVAPAPEPVRRVTGREKNTRMTALGLFREDHEDFRRGRKMTSPGKELSLPFPRQEQAAHSTDTAHPARAFLVAMTKGRNFGF